MDVPALVSARVGAIATRSNTLRTPSLADVEGEGLRVLRDVGLDVVLADTLVLQLVGVALVLDGGRRGDAGLLRANERALSPLVEAPAICSVLG
jgi:hypothetical protein